MVKHLSRYLNRLNKNFTKSCGLRRILKSNGHYLYTAYICVKIIYICNIVLQIYLLNKFLGMDYHMYGFGVMFKMFNGQNWSTSERFPRVTFCDFKIRVLGNIHAYTVQCSLPMNLLNEMIFIFLWFWFFFVGAFTVGSLLIWIWTSLYMPSQRKDVKRRLMARDKIDCDEKKKRVGKFVDEYLRKDGCFILKLVTRNASDLVTAELLAGIWDNYCDMGKSKTRNGSTDGNASVVSMEDNALLPDHET